MPPSYIVVKSTWLSGESQSQQPQPQPQSGHSPSFKVIKQPNQTSLEVLVLKWNLAKVRHVEFSLPPLLVLTDRKRFNKMMRTITTTEKEQTWRLLANNSEGFLSLNLANSLLV